MKLDHEDLNRLIDKISTSDIQEFSLEGEDFKLEIKRNLLDQNQVANSLVPNNSLKNLSVNRVLHKFTTDFLMASSFRRVTRSLVIGLRVKDKLISLNAREICTAIKNYYTLHVSIMVFRYFSHFSSQD